MVDRAWAINATAGRLLLGNWLSGDALEGNLYLVA